MTEGGFTAFSSLVVNISKLKSLGRKLHTLRHSQATGSF